MKLFLTMVAIVCLFTGTALAGRLVDEWNVWKEKYDKHYSEEEDGTRFNLWKTNHKAVMKHNVLFDRGESTYKMGMNIFAATTLEEFGALLIPSSSAGLSFEPASNVSSYFPDILDVPETVDWRQERYVTPVKNQGQLGSCYSFSAVGAVEGQYSKHFGNLLSLSEQQVVDCNQGGDGGFPYRVYKYLMKCGGSETEADYPYVDKVGSCKFDSSKVAAKISTYRFVRPFGNERAVKVAVAKVGPISISSIKIFMSFQLYASGIYYEPKCNDPNLDGQGYHAMLATGYGTQDGQDYWMVKNSWGTGWGEKGYIQMSRNRDNNCGIASQPTYPIMSNNQPRNYANAEEPTTPGGAMTHLPSLFVILIALLPVIHIQSN